MNRGQGERLHDSMGEEKNEEEEKKKESAADALYYIIKNCQIVYH